MGFDPKPRDIPSLQELKESIANSLISLRDNHLGEDYSPASRYNPSSKIASFHSGFGSEEENEIQLTNAISVKRDKEKFARSCK